MQIPKKEKLKSIITKNKWTEFNDAAYKKQFCPHQLSLVKTTTGTWYEDKKYKWQNLSLLVKVSNINNSIYVLNILVDFFS